MILTINNFSTSSLPGCQVLDIGEVRAATPRQSDITVYGVNGRLMVNEAAFDGYERSLTFLTKTIAEAEKLIEAFVVGKNQLVFSYQPDSLYYCDYLDSHYQPKGLHYWEVVVKVYMHPFRYAKTVADVVLTGAGTVTNPGTVYAEPVIVIEGSGPVSLTIGQQTMHLTLDTKAAIICTHKEQKVLDKNGAVRNTIRSRGPFFELAVGRSGVSMTGAVRKVTIKGNWRYRI